MERICSIELTLRRRRESNLCLLIICESYCYPKTADPISWKYPNNIPSKNECCRIAIDTARGRVVLEYCNWLRQLTLDPMRVFRYIFDINY